ncbi:MAG: phosphoglucomutase [Desulfurococcales archaeon]|nr:phosphoglucomutase [Desulfurococcales archaeon]
MATYVSGGSIAVGGDGRLTTPLLKLAVSVGLMAAGADVVDAGLVPLPALAWYVSRHRCSAGVYVTASHNPPTDNGIKVFKSNGMEFLISDEEKVEEIVAGRSWRFADWDSVGTYEVAGEVISEYLEELGSALAPEEVRRIPKVLVDTANGAASLTTPKLLKDLGADVVSINSNIDGRFPGRCPEPRPDVLEPFTPVAKGLGADVYLAHDGDGDRLAVVDPKAGFIKQDRLIALIAKYKLSSARGKVVVSVDCGNAVKDVVESMGGELVVVKLGKVHEGLAKHGSAVIAAEPWKLIDPSWGPWIDGVYQAGLLVKLMIEEGKDIHALMSEIPNYPQARYSIRVPKEQKEGLYEALREYLLSQAPESAEVLTIDGVRINYEDKSWVLVRVSGTEPKVRIYGEALTVKKLEHMVNELLSKAREYLRSKGIEEPEIEGKIIP